jgi:hypothetical protein
MAAQTQRVGVLTGELNRTWKFEDPTGKSHEVSLYHHTITGARGAMLDFVELPDSIGTTTILKSKHTIWFDAGGGWRGSILIKRKGMADFIYECVVGGKIIPECMSTVVTNEPTDTFELKVLKGEVASYNPFYGSGGSDDQIPVTWYPIKCTRLSDGAKTTVHRRFRDFVDLDESVRAGFQGRTHLKSSLPELPPKNSKILYDHADPEFQEARREKLELYIQKLVQVPRVLQISTVCPFLGMSGHVIERSVLFPAKSIGVTIQSAGGTASKQGVSASISGAGFPGVVEAVRDGPAVGLVEPGDIVSKVNGMTTISMKFPDIVNLVAKSPRPIVLHFLHGNKDMSCRPLQAAAEALGDSQPAEEQETQQKPRSSFESIEGFEDDGGNVQAGQFVNV